MTNAKRDQNDVPTKLAVVASTGTTVAPIQANPTNHGMSVDNNTTGSDAGPTGRALRDENFVTTLMAVSSADGTTPVALYIDGTGKLLINSN